MRPGLLIVVFDCEAGELGVVNAKGTATVVNVLSIQSLGDKGSHVVMDHMSVCTYDKYKNKYSTYTLYVLVQ